jgi:hypothetical protein
MPLMFQFERKPKLEFDFGFTGFGFIMKLPLAFTLQFDIPAALSRDTAFSEFIEMSLSDEEEFLSEDIMYRLLSSRDGLEELECRLLDRSIDLLCLCCPSTELSACTL